MAHRRNRFGAALVGVVALLGALLLGTGTANAAPCPPGGSPGGYPPNSCNATISASVVVQGGTITVTGSGFGADVTVTVTLHSDPVQLAQVSSDGSGNASATVTIPADTPPGRHTITLEGTGADGSARVLSVAFTVVPPAAGNGAANAGTHDNSGLPFTGAWVGPMSGAGVLLVIGGVFLVVTFRRRRLAATA